MAATSNKQKVLNQFFSLLQKKGSSEQESRTVVESFVYAICYEGTSRSLADRAYNNLKTQFFDWNEIRVSSVKEVEEALEGLPDAEPRAQRIILFLQEVFEQTFSFDLEALHKKKGGVKQAAQLLARYEAASEHTVAWVVQHCLDGHSLPLDEPTRRTAGRLGFIDAENKDRSHAQSSLEHLVPKAKGKEFIELIKHVAHEHCWEEEPDCAGCPLQAECPTGQTQPATSSRSRKPR